MKNVFYISYDGLTDPLGQSQVLPYLIGLSKIGYQITVLSAEKQENFVEKKTQIENLCQEGGIDWQPISYTKKPPVFSTLKDVYTLFKRAKQLHQQKHFQILHCRSYISALVGLHFKRKYGTKFLFDMRGFWADERRDGKIWNIEKQPYKLIYNYFKKKEIEFFQEADYTVSLTQNGIDEIQSWQQFENIKLPISVIPCCVDTDRFDVERLDLVKQSELKNKFNFTDKYVLSYLGSIGTWYMLDEMLDFFVELKKQQANAVFFFITGESENFIKEKAREKGIQEADVVVVRANYTEVPLYLSLSNASVFFIKPAYSKKASSPVKQGELMSMGIPIVCNAGVGDTDLIIKKYGCGSVIESFNQENYAAASQLLINNPPKASNGVFGAQDFFSLNKGVELYAEIYKKLS